MPQNINSMPSTIQQDEMQEMLGHPPGWILRSGITLIFLVVTISLILSWLIRYPDELPARMTIIQSVPPHEIRPLISARVDTILLNDGASVEAGGKIAILESGANWQDVEAIWQLVYLNNSDHDLEWPEDVVLGNLQAPYAAFLEARIDLYFFKNRTIFLEKQKAGREEILSLKELEKAYEAQRTFFLKEKNLVEKNLERAQTLHQEGVTSSIELEEQQKQILQYERQLKNLDITLLQNRVRIQQLETQIVEKKDEYYQNKNVLELQLKQTRRQLKGALEEWYSQYILTSPIAGKLEWNRSIYHHYTVNAGSLLGMVVQQDSNNEAIAQLHLPSLGIGKVVLGSPVKISLDAYPEQEFGKITAQIDEISLAPTDNEEKEAEYILKVYLQDTLKTTYGKRIPLQPNMPGTANVITKDRRILERILQQFLNVLKNN